MPSPPGVPKYQKMSIEEIHARWPVTKEITAKHVEDGEVILKLAQTLEKMNDKAYERQLARLEREKAEQEEADRKRDAEKANRPSRKKEPW